MPSTSTAVPPTPIPPPSAAENDAAATATATSDAVASPPPPEDPRGSMLAAGGYPLTPGVSSEPIKSELVLSGYGQAQYEGHQDSEDQLRQGGALVNQNRFLLRRGRLRVTRDWDFGQAIIEIDGNTSRGPTMRLQKAELSLIYGRSPQRDQPPLVQFTLGQFDVPFGFEMIYSPKYRWFMERTQASRALFPGEPDVGARLSGGIGFARYSIAVTNGEPLDEKSGLGLQDPNSNKDVTARLGAETKPTESLALAGGVSFNAGRGFHPGTDATKSTLAWNDINENGMIDSMTEITGTAAQQATPSQTFKRWGVGIDAEALLKTKLGWSMLYGELMIANNLDRGLYVADPVINKGLSQRELGYYVAFTQEITRFGVIGFRYDFYDPNADATDSRGGKFLPTSIQVKTFSPMIGLAFPDRARLVFQWDIIDDFFARDTSGVPHDLKNNQVTLRLQGML